MDKQSLFEFIKGTTAILSITGAAIKLWTTKFNQKDRSAEVSNHADSLALLDSQEPTNRWGVELGMKKLTSKSTPYPILKKNSQMTSPMEGFKLFHAGRSYLTATPSYGGLKPKSERIRRVLKCIFDTTTFVLLGLSAYVLFRVLTHAHEASSKQLGFGLLSVLWLFAMAIFYATFSGAIRSAEQFDKLVKGTSEDHPEKA